MGVGGLIERKTGAGQVDYLAVDPERQHQGIGSVLLDRMEHAAKEDGMTAMEISAHGSAVVFYERKGYERDGRYHDPSGGVVTLQKPLS